MKNIQFFQAKEYVKLLGQFKELGFSDDKIQEALINSNLDENKTLDVLTSSWKYDASFSNECEGTSEHIKIRHFQNAVSLVQNGQLLINQLFQRKLHSFNYVPVQSFGQ